MSLHDLPPQRPPLTAEGRGYAERVLKRSRAILQSHRSLLDRPYGTDYYQRVDAFPPDPTAGPVPILVFAHGGAWIAGFKEWMAFMAPAITALPAAFVSVSYRLAPECKFPGPLDDCLDAIAWAYDHASEIGGDRSRMFVGGHSAGGHLMALTALRPEARSVRGLPHDLIKGCLTVSAPFDLRGPDTTRREVSPSSDALTKAYSALLVHESDAIAASPIVHVSSGAPPFLISIGEKDFPALRDQAERMRHALVQAGISTVYLELADHDHFATNERSVEPDHPWLVEVRRMMGQPGGAKPSAIRTVGAQSRAS